MNSPRDAVSENFETPGVTARGVASVLDLPEDDLHLVDTGAIPLDRSSLARFEANERVPLVVDGCRWQLDLLTRFGQKSGDVFEFGHRQFDSVENQHGFVPIGQVDQDLGLRQDLAVVRRRRDVDDGVGVSECVTSGGGRRETEEDQHQTDGDGRAHHDDFRGQFPAFGSLGPTGFHAVILADGPVCSHFGAEAVVT